MPNPYYPRYVTRPDGAVIVVQDHIQHAAHVGYPVNEDGTPVERPDSDESMEASAAIMDAQRELEPAPVEEPKRTRKKPIADPLGILPKE